MRNRPEALMIFAAGLGRRMAPLTDTVPKPLVRVCGRPLIDHALDLASRAGIGRVVVNTHHLADQICHHLAGRPDIALSHEPLLLETGGGLKAALPLLGAGPVLTLNSDAVWTGPNPLGTLLAGWRPGIEALALLVPKARAAGYAGPGDFLIGPNGRLQRGPGEVYSGAQILDPGRVAARSDTVFSLNAVWDDMIRAGTLHGIRHDGGWCDVGRPESIPMAEALLAGVRHV